MKIFEITKPNRHILGKITLDGSKSISNRLLIIKALCKENFDIQKISTSKDTTTLSTLLAQFSENANGTFDAGAAGTTFRFLTAFFAMQQGTQILTGSERMKQRPIEKLVNVLRSLGCQIDYLEKEGFPPLRIGAPSVNFEQRQLTIAADTSSQYITALLLIAPSLPQGLELTLEGKIVSRPYIEMTLGLMSYFGITYTWVGNVISIAPQPYEGRAFVVEADWSAASYYYALSAFADKLDLELKGVFPASLQGDSVLMEMGNYFGIKTEATEGGIRLTKSGEKVQSLFEWDFVRCPDIAQTLAVMCAGTEATGLFTGLETLFIKETDRIAALTNELQKIDVHFFKIPARFASKNPKDFFMLEGMAHFKNVPTFATYEDHRMAMSFAPLALFAPIRVAEPDVVVKSYPKFWQDMETLGFKILELGQ